MYFKWNHPSFGQFPISNPVLNNWNLSVSPSVIYPHSLFVSWVNRCTAEKVNLIPSLPAHLALKHLWLWRCNTSNWICPGTTVKYSRMEYNCVVFKMFTYRQSSWEIYKLQQDNSNRPTSLKDISVWKLQRHHFECFLGYIFKMLNLKPYVLPDNFLISLSKYDIFWKTMYEMFHLF